MDYGGVLTDVGEPSLLTALAAARVHGLRTALLSNADAPPPDLPDLFDVVVVSGEVGLAKPDPAVFRLVAERLGVPVRHCVFVDDLAGYVRAAASAGMTGVRHRDPESTVEELEALLGFDLRQ